MFVVFQYWMTCQPEHWDQALNIESMFGHSDFSAVTILDYRPLRCFRCSNIGCYVSLIHAVKHWILGQCSATPMFPMFQYWMLCQPDPCGLALDIELTFGHFDVSSVSILNDMSAWSLGSGIKYWVNVWPLRCSNIGCYISLICAVKHWIFSQSLATPGCFRRSRY